MEFKCMNKFLILLVTLLPFVSVANEDEDENFMSSFIVGDYVLVGQGIDSDKAYSGKVSIYFEGEELEVERIINGKTTMGRANIETALNGDAWVLRIRFIEKEVKYEETCLVGSDLDNYARITCYLYIPGSDIAKPGLESLFIDIFNRD
jgi:hypothetical protein